MSTSGDRMSEHRVWIVDHEKTRPVAPPMARGTSRSVLDPVVAIQNAASPTASWATMSSPSPTRCSTWRRTRTRRTRAPPCRGQPRAPAEWMSRLARVQCALSSSSEDLDRMLCVASGISADPVETGDGGARVDDLARPSNGPITGRDYLCPRGILDGHPPVMARLMARPRSAWASAPLDCSFTSAGVRPPTCVRPPVCAISRGSASLATRSDGSVTREQGRAGASGRVGPVAPTVRRSCRRGCGRC